MCIKTVLAVMTAVGALGATTGVAHAQGVPNPGAATGQPTSNDARQLKDSRYQIGQMERVLQGAVEHGAGIIRDRLRALMPADMLLSESARVRGFRLDGYGVFFDVEVPDLEGTLPWSFRTLDQNGLGLMSAWNAIRTHIEPDAAKDAHLQEALKRLELQVAPLAASMSQAQQAQDDLAQHVAGTTAVPSPAGSPAPPPGEIFNNPEEAYREAVKEALMDAMIEHSRGLEVGANEWLTVAARRNDSGPRIAPVNTDARTVVIRVRGADLSAFLGGQIGRDEARARMDVRVF